MTMQDPTIEGITKQFFTGKESLGLFTDEGAKVFGGHSMSKGKSLAAIGHLSNFWDGMPIERTRSGDKTSFMLHDKRLTVCIMTQPDIFFSGLGTIAFFKHKDFFQGFLLLTPKQNQEKGFMFFTKEFPKTSLCTRISQKSRLPYKIPS